MKKLLYYSDCFVFGGCEKLLVNLITSRAINDNFQVDFAYANNADYRHGVERDLPRHVRRHPLAILDNYNLFYRIDKRGLNRVLAFCLKVPFALIDRTGLYAVYNLFRLLLLFKKMRPDLLHINNGGYPAARSCLVAVFSAWLAGVPRIVITVNNLAFEQRSLLEKAIDRFIGRRVDRFVTASSMAGRMLLERRGFDAGKLMQIYNGIPADIPRENRDELLAEFGIASDKFVLTTVALLTERKGQLSLLRALDSIRKSSPPVYQDTVLILVGDGEDRLLLEDYVALHGMTGSVIFTGHRDDFLDFIAAADVFVLPSLRNEDMPLVILSSMSCGTPTISTRVAGIVEQVRDGIDGVLVDPGDTEALAAAIERFYRDPNLAASCGAHAREHFRASFSLESLEQNYLRLYHELTDD